jgi:hypothetical protein
MLKIGNLLDFFFKKEKKKEIIIAILNTVFTIFDILKNKD